MLVILNGINQMLPLFIVKLQFLQINILWHVFYTELPKIGKTVLTQFSYVYN